MSSPPPSARSSSGCAGRTPSRPRRSRSCESRGLLREGERSVNAMYTFIEAEKTTYGVAFLCRLLKVARPRSMPGSPRRRPGPRARRPTRTWSMRSRHPRGHPPYLRRAAHPYRTAAPGPGGEPQTRRPPHARALHPGRHPSQAPFADTAGQEGQAGPGPDRPQLPCRGSRHETGRRHHRSAHIRGPALPRLLAGPGHPRGRRLLDGRLLPRRPCRRCAEDGRGPGRLRPSQR